MDEPFSNLDSRLREKTSLELRRLQQELLMTVVLVTHDKNEALTISDKVAVMNKGRIEQLGTPLSVYQRPRTEFVARFVSDSNIFTGIVRSTTGGVTMEMTDGPAIQADGTASADFVGKGAKVAIRPDAMRLSPAQATPTEAVNTLAGTVEVAAFQGSLSKFSIATSRGTVSVILDPSKIHEYQPGTSVTVSWDSAEVVLLEDEA
jgi:ABC-type Fe3+/spermidine/putrescine transport system ATPase subunit